MSWTGSLSVGHRSFPSVQMSIAIGRDLWLGEVKGPALTSGDASRGHCCSRWRCCLRKMSLTVESNGSNIDHWKITFTWTGRVLARVWQLCSLFWSILVITTAFRSVFCMLFYYLWGSTVQKTKELLENIDKCSYQFCVQYASSSQRTERRCSVFLYFDW